MSCIKGKLIYILVEMIEWCAILFYKYVLIEK